MQMAHVMRSFCAFSPLLFRSASERVTDTKAYEVKKGESVWTICSGEDPIPTWLFKKYNRSVDLALLRPGAGLTIPVVSRKDRQEGPPEPVAEFPLLPWMTE